MESETEKSTEDEESSESETVSGSASESEEVRHVFGAWNVVMDRIIRIYHYFIKCAYQGV